MSFLEPEHEPLSRRKKVMLGGIVAMSVLVAADAFKLVNLHGFGLPLLMSMSIFMTLNQRWEREQDDANG
jgi:hypothetical protein